MNIPYHLSFEISFSALDPFLRYWACRYRDSDRDTTLYDPHIRTANLQTDWKALKALFEWKNGGTIAKPKLASVRTNYFEDWTDDDHLECRYLDFKKGGGPIWNIFYLHCRHPDKYPIYDQHTYRAMRFMETGNLEELISGTSIAARAEIFRSYGDYMSFASKLDANKRKVDRALYTFGQFLKLAKSFSA